MRRRLLSTSPQHTATIHSMRRALINRKALVEEEMAMDKDGEVGEVD